MHMLNGTFSVGTGKITPLKEEFNQYFDILSTRTIKINESETNVALKAVLAFTAIYTCIVPALKK